VHYPGDYGFLPRTLADGKVLAVPVNDPYSAEIHPLSDGPQHSPKGIGHFFHVYKDFEGVTTRTRGFEGATEAGQAISDAMQLYRKKFGITPRRPSAARGSPARRSPA
jgi:inorganic pyrophosphatase